MRRLLTALVVAGACTAGVLFATGASNKSASGRTYHILFDNAFGLVSGGDLKIGGVRAGQTTGFDVRKAGGRYVADVTAKVNKPGFTAFKSDASCHIRLQSLIGEYYVDCQPGSKGADLPNNGTVPLSQTVSVIPQDLLNDVMRKPYRERFRLIISELGVGLAGRPQDLSAVLHKAVPGLEETDKTLAILGRQNKILKDFVTNSDIVVKQLARRRQDVARWVTESGRTAQISASRSTALRESWHKLPTFLGELRPTMVELGKTADQQIPLLRRLHQAAPQLTRFFNDLGPFSEASRPSFRSLGQAAVIGRTALRKASNEIAELRKVARNAPGTGKPLRQLLQAMDTRDRAIEPDPRAGQSAPPAPDPTAYHNGQGFTGYENLWNYFFWQTLAINPFDQFGHLLRVALFVNDCSSFQTGPITPQNKALFQKCNGWTGPYQPGVNTTDPTGNPRAAKASQRKQDQQAQKQQPKGQKDFSATPKVVLPPPVQELLKKLPSAPTTSLPSVPTVPNNVVPAATTGTNSGQTTDKLLDFLLGP